MPPPGLAKTVCAPMPGLLTRLMVEAGDVIEAGQNVAVIEAMKMENTLAAQIRGTVLEISANTGDNLNVDDVIPTLLEGEIGGPPGFGIATLLAIPGKLNWARMAGSAGRTGIGARADHHLGDYSTPLVDIVTHEGAEMDFSDSSFDDALTSYSLSMLRAGERPHLTSRVMRNRILHYQGCRVGTQAADALSGRSGRRCYHSLYPFWNFRKLLESYLKGGFTISLSCLTRIKASLAALSTSSRLRI